MKKYLFFGSAVAGNAADEELLLVPLESFSHVTNGNANELQMKFKNTSPGSPAASQMDNIQVQFTCADANIRTAMLNIAEKFAAFAKDDSQHILTVYDETPTFVTSIDSNFSALRLTEEEVA